MNGKINSPAVKKWEESGLLLHLDDERKIELAEILEELTPKVITILNAIPEEKKFFDDRIILPIITRVYRHSGIKVDVDRMFGLLFKTEDVFNNLTKQEEQGSKIDAEAEYCAYVSKTYAINFSITERIKKLNEKNI